MIRNPFREFSPETRRVLRIDISATLLVMVFGALTGPFIGLILRRDFGATPFQLSVMASAGAVFMLLSLGWARAIDGRAPLPYVVWPGFIARGLFLLVPLIHSAWEFVALLIVVNMLGTMAGPAQAAVVERVYPRSQRGRAVGLVKMAAGLPGIALLIGAGHLLGVADYRYTFPIAGVIGMLASLRQRHLPVPPPAAGTAPEPTGLREAWATLRRDTALRRLLLASFIFGLGIRLQQPATPILMADVLRVTTTQVGVFAAAAALAGMLGYGYWGRLVDARTSLRALRLVYLVGALVPLTYYVAWTPWVLLGSSVMDSLMITGLDLVFTLALVDIAGPRRTSHYVAIATTLAGVRGVLGPLAGAWLIEVAGVHAVYLVASATMLTAAWVLSRHLRRAPATERLLRVPATAG